MSSKNRLNATEKDAILVNSPFYHCMSCVLASLNMVIRGARLVIPAPTFSAIKAVEAINEENANIIIGTPTRYIDMLDAAKQSKFKLNTSDTRGWMRGLMGGSICPEQLVRDVTDVFDARIFISYGTTETSPVTFFSTATDSLVNLTTTVGCVMPHTEAKVIGLDDQVLPREVTGELCIRGPCVFPGYWKQPDKTKEVVGHDGWYRTGDLASISHDGYAKIIGRSKDMIIRYEVSLTGRDSHQPEVVQKLNHF